MKVENICNFYASNYHLSVVLYEYLLKNNKKNIITFFEEGIDEEIKLLENKRKNIIKNKINFSSNINIEETEINETKNIIFILRGSNVYLKLANTYIKDKIKHMKNVKAKVINCYDFNNQGNLMSSVIKGSDKILYTTGEKIID